jgi:hypothetical protein
LASLAWVMMYWVEGVDVAFSERREDDLHEKITRVCVRRARGAGGKIILAGRKSHRALHFGHSPESTRRVAYGA